MGAPGWGPYAQRLAQDEFRTREQNTSGIWSYDAYFGELGSVSYEQAAARQARARGWEDKKSVDLGSWLPAADRQSSRAVAAFTIWGLPPTATRACG